MCGTPQSTCDITHQKARSREPTCTRTHIPRTNSRTHHTQTHTKQKYSNVDKFICTHARFGESLKTTHTHTHTCARTHAHIPRRSPWRARRNGVQWRSQYLTLFPSCARAEKFPLHRALGNRAPDAGWPGERHIETDRRTVPAWVHGEKNTEVLQGACMMISG